MPKFTKQILRPGTYWVSTLTGDRRPETITPERIQNWVETFTRMREAGLKVPAPFYRHVQTAIPVASKADLKTLDPETKGFWDKVWHDPQDGSLWGTLDVPLEEDAKVVGTKLQDVSIYANTFQDGLNRRWEDALLHIALVPQPVEPNQANFQQSEGLLCSAAYAYSGFSPISSVPPKLQGFQMAVDPKPATKPEPESKDNSQQGDSSQASSSEGNTKSQFATALECLASRGISLPDDTDQSNFFDRLITACHALQAFDGNKNDEEETPEVEEEGELDVPNKPNTSSRREPPPIAMSLDMSNLSLKPEEAAKVLEAVKFTTKDEQGKEVIMDFGSLATMLSEVKEAKNPTSPAAESALKKALDIRIKHDYVSRIDDLVRDGRVTREYADKELVPLVDGIQMSLTETGEVAPTSLDTILSALEKLPKHTGLFMSAGYRPSTAKPETRQEATDRTADDIVNEFLTNTGRNGLAVK